MRWPTRDDSCSFEQSSLCWTTSIQQRLGSASSVPLERVGAVPNLVERTLASWVTRAGA